MHNPASFSPTDELINDKFCTIYAHYGLVPKKPHGNHSDHLLPQLLRLLSKTQKKLYLIVTRSSIYHSIHKGLPCILNLGSNNNIMTWLVLSSVSWKLVLGLDSS